MFLSSSACSQQPHTPLRRPSKYTSQITFFVPDIVKIPAQQKVRLMIINDGPSPEEFESYELNREKVIAGGSKAIIFVGPLAQGDYPFFGEFNPKSAQGILRVVDQVAL